MIGLGCSVKDIDQRSLRFKGDNHHFDPQQISGEMSWFDQILLDEMLRYCCEDIISLGFWQSSESNTTTPGYWYHLVYPTLKPKTHTPFLDLWRTLKLIHPFIWHGKMGVAFFWRLRDTPLLPIYCHLFGVDLKCLPEALTSRLVELQNWTSLVKGVLCSDQFGFGVTHIADTRASSDCGDGHQDQDHQRPTTNYHELLSNTIEHRQYHDVYRTM